jgi:hypothetical protein
MSQPPATRPKPLRDSHGRLLPGGGPLNPKGRPRSGFAAAEIIREHGEDTGLLREVIQLAFNVALGRPVLLDMDYLAERAQARRDGLPDPPRRGEAVQPTITEMQRAWEFLLAWGYRKPPQEVEINGTPSPVDYGRLSDAELDALEALHAKAAGILDVPGGG